MQAFHYGMGDHLERLSHRMMACWHDWNEMGGCYRMMVYHYQMLVYYHQMLVWCYEKNAR
jgi:hypothetical protein